MSTKLVLSTALFRYMTLICYVFISIIFRHSTICIIKLQMLMLYYFLHMLPCVCNCKGIHRWNTPFPNGPSVLEINAIKISKALYIFEPQSFPLIFAPARVIKIKQINKIKAVLNKINKWKITEINNKKWIKINVITK